MSWFTPWALVGASLVALPILIHMMGRGRTTVIRFPSLRFLETSRILPARRTRIHDIALLVLRAGAIVAAAVALAQPLVRALPTAPVVDGGLARIVVLDTSASMRRAATGFSAAAGATVGKRIADSLANGATRVAVVRAADLRNALANAAAWAATQSGQAEVALVSDFQRGALDSASVAALDPAIGIALHGVRVNAAAIPLSRTRQGGADVTARIVLVGDRTDVEWSISPPVAHAFPIQLRSGAAATALVTATRRGAEAVGVPWWVTTVPAVGAIEPGIAVVFPGDASLATLAPNGQPLTGRRQAGIVARLLNDPLLAAVSSASPESPVDRVGTTIENGRPVLSVVSRVGVGTAASAALLAALERAASTAPPVSELDPEFISDATLATWRRAAGDRPALTSAKQTEAAEFDGRWFWLFALILLGIEALVRRAPNQATDVA